MAYFGCRVGPGIASEPNCVRSERLVASLRSLHGRWTLLPKQSRHDLEGQPLDGAAPYQSAKEILHGSLVDQVFPAEYDVAELSTSETDPKTESSVADARDSSAVENAHEEADSKTEKP